MGRKSREKAERKTQSGAPLVSIVILVRNGRDVTRACLESVARFTPESHEIVIVDNGSERETAAYLEAYARANTHVRLIINGYNLGFPAGANQGLAASRGQYVLLLNNDVVVTEGWLSRMLAAFERDPAIGLVGPRGDRVGGQQAVPEAIGVADFAGFARAWSAKHAGQGQAADNLIGFALLIRREVLDAIGGMDPRFGLGNYEDDDFCKRARLAGFNCWQSDDVLLKHAESATFIAEGLDVNDLMARNGKIFKKKWAGSPDLFIPIGTSDPRPKPTVSLCMTTHNDGDFLEDCLRSAADLVDEICIVDMSSTDRTVEIAESFGATIERRDDYRSARDASFEMATGDYLLVLDATERLLPTARLLLPKIVGACANGLAFRILTPTGSEVAVSLATRMLRKADRRPFDERRPDSPLSWDEAGDDFSVGGLDICDEAYRRSIWDSAGKGDPRIGFGGSVVPASFDLVQRARMATAAPVGERIESLRSALAQSAKLGPYAGHAYALLSRLLIEAGQAQEAIAVARQGLAQRNSANADLWFQFGGGLHQSGDSKGAIDCYRQSYLLVSQPDAAQIGDVKLWQIIDAMNRCAADLGDPPFHLVSKGGKHRRLESHLPPDLPADGSCEVLRWVGSEPVALSLLIPSLSNRADSFERLYTKLKAQAGSEPVEILALRDSGELSTGWKRQWLNWRASGAYLAHIDDDDDVAADYVSTLLAAIGQNPDAVVFDGQRFEDGVRKERMFFTKASPCPDVTPDAYQSAANHLMVYRTALARLVAYPDTSHAEDEQWALVAAPMIDKEIRLYETLYLYRDSKQKLALRRRANDRLATDDLIRAACEVVRPLIGTEPIELSILIPTLCRREEPFTALVAELRRQCEGRPVEVLAVRDDGQAPTGTKRNWLKTHAAGRFVVFIDDDDAIAPDYVDTLLGAMAANPEADCIVFDVLRFVDGIPDRPARYSKAFSHADLPEEYRRQPNHIMAFRVDLANREDFPNRSFGEDTAWAQTMAPLITSEARINAVLYHYRDTAFKAPPALAAV